MAYNSEDYPVETPLGEQIDGFGDGIEEEGDNDPYDGDDPPILDGDGDDAPEDEE